MKKNIKGDKVQTLISDDRIKEVQIVYEIADRIEMLTGEEDWFVAKYKEGKELPDFLDHYYNYYNKEGKELPDFLDHYKKTGFVARLNKPQSLLLGQVISKKVFPDEEYKFSLPSLQSSFYRGHSDKDFRQIMTGYWIHNSEIIKQTGEIIPYPSVVVKNGKFKYKGESIKADIKDNIIDTLIGAGLFKKPKERVWDHSICFENGKSSVMSGWAFNEDCYFPVLVPEFNAHTNSLSYTTDFRIAIFEKIEKEKDMKITSAEYRKLRKYEELVNALLHDDTRHKSLGKKDLKGQ